MIQITPSQKTILVIDDSQQDREQWRDGLQELSPHFLFVEAADGKSGLDICRRRQVDCVILDLDLPDISGFEVLFSLNLDRHHPTIAVVVLTRMRSPVIHQMTKENGAHECLVKDYATLDVLDKAINRAMRIVGTA